MFLTITSLLACTALLALTAVKQSQRKGLIVRCPRTNKWVPAPSVMNAR